MRGVVGGGSIKQANIIDDKSPIFGYHAGLNLPSVTSVKGSTSMAEVDEGIYWLQVHIYQE